jgi:hypothetical protein
MLAIFWVWRSEGRKQPGTSVDFRAKLTPDLAPQMRVELSDRCLEGKGRIPSCGDHSTGDFAVRRILTALRKSGRTSCFDLSLTICQYHSNLKPET